jgi:hypothetical protein
MAHPADYSPYVAEIQRLQSALAAHTGSYQLGADFGMPVALQATPMSVDRPREFYCWLHGWNSTHHGTKLQNHGANTAYTPMMKDATGPTNTEGNPKVGVPVHLHRSHFTFFVRFLLVCLVCPHHHHPPHKHHPPPARLRQTLKNAPGPMKPLEHDPRAQAG